MASTLILSSKISMKFLLAAALIAAIGGGISHSSGEIVQDQSPHLFYLVEPAQAKPIAERSSVASRRESVIEFTAPSVSANRSSRLRFPLFDNKIYEAVRHDFEERGVDDFTWRGKIEKTDNDVILTFKNDHVVGLIYAPDAVYEIMPRGEKHILVELDPGAFPNCAGDVKAPSAKLNVQRSAPSGAEDSGDRIDVLVLYTANVRLLLGSEDAALAVAQAVIDSANTTYLQQGPPAPPPGPGPRNGLARNGISYRGA